MNIREKHGVCEHIAADSYPFQVELVIDDHIGLTDGIVRCRRCRRVYLLEMLDWGDEDRLFRISALADDHARRLIRDLTSGSCDVQRADAEVLHMKTAATFAPWLILVDASVPTIRCVVPLPRERNLPGAGWRNLPCDGTWVAYARACQGSGSERSNTAMVKG